MSIITCSLKDVENFLVVLNSGPNAEPCPTM